MIQYRFVNRATADGCVFRCCVCVIERIHLHHHIELSSVELPTVDTEEKRRKKKSSANATVESFEYTHVIQTHLVTHLLPYQADLYYFHI